MTGIFKFLLGVFIFIFLVRVLVYYVLPWFIKRKLEKMQAQHDQENDNRKEGEIRVEDTTSQKEYPNKSDIGEYVDYEDVD